MTDSHVKDSSSKPPSPKPQWVSDEDQPIVGRIVTMGNEPNPNTSETIDEPLGKIGRSKLAILTTVFLVAGVLGVPLIVYSPVFSKFEKVFWSAVAAAYSGTLFYILYAVIVWAQSRL